MARSLTLKAILNFTFDNHAELTSMRSAASTFATNNDGTYKIVTNEDDANTSCPYFGRLELEFEPATRAASASLMGNIDNALSGLPDLYRVNGHYLRYKFVEDEV